MRRSRRTIAVLGVLGLLVLAIVPSLVAAHYSGGPGGVQGVAWRPDKGWRFIVDAVTHSRGAQLGSSQSADERAHDVWAGARTHRPRGDVGATARAADVELVWNDGPFRVPVPEGGVMPSPDNAVARPRGPFAWIVYGRLRGGARQMIGMLDLDSGRPLWDIRDGLGAR